MSLLTGLVSHWKLNEVSGVRADSHGTNHLTDNATVGQGTGKLGNAADFIPGNSEFFSVAVNAGIQFGDSDFSIAVWVSIDDKSTNRTIIAEYADSVSSFHLHYYNSGDRFRWTVITGAGSEVHVSANNLGSPSTGTWYFIVAWHDSVANTINIQVNDGTVNSASHSGGTGTATGQLRIGTNSANIWFWDGLMDSISVAGRVWTAAERTQLYNAGNGLDYTSFVPSGGLLVNPSMDGGMT